jgi:hypothetical protein
VQFAVSIKQILMKVWVWCVQTGNILAPIITHTLYSLVIVGNGLRRIHDNREKLRQRVNKIAGRQLTSLKGRESGPWKINYWHYWYLAGILTVFVLRSTSISFFLVTSLLPVSSTYRVWEGSLDYYLCYMSSITNLV